MRLGLLLLCLAPRGPAGTLSYGLRSWGGEVGGGTEASGKIKSGFWTSKASARRGSQEQEELPRGLRWDI